ncbi:MAG: ACT domain-containing protein [Bacteroidales bacterium]|nr:ACT domain-containing protein [Bacteroidales bacterium]
MITRVFKLTEASAKYMDRLPVEDAILVVKSEHKVRQMFIDALETAMYGRADTKPAFGKIASYFKALVPDPAFGEKVDAELKALRHYVDEGVVYRPSFETIRDYVLAKCARLCAATVHAVVGGTFVDGAEVMVCEEDHGAFRVDWKTSMERLQARTAQPGLYVLSSGYGHTPQGFSIRLGRRGEDLMALTIAARHGTSAEFFVLDDRILDIPALTYEEAAVFCSVADGVLAPAALLPMMKAGLPVVVRDLADPARRTVVSAVKPASEHVVTGYVVEEGFALINVRGTGLVGRVGVSSSIFGALARGGVNIRYISQPSSEFCITVAVSNEDLPAAKAALSALYGDGQVSLDDAVEIIEDVCLLSVCGNGMKNVPGTSGRIYTALGVYGVNIISAAQGGDELTISFVIKASDRQAVEEALSIL